MGAPFSGLHATPVREDNRAVPTRTPSPVMVGATVLIVTLPTTNIPEEIVRKPGRLTATEFEIMKRHAKKVAGWPKRSGNRLWRRSCGGTTSASTAAI